MRLLAKIYIGTILLLGVACIVLADWHITSPWAFAGVLAVSLLASGMKVRLPGIFGTLSVNYFFILIGIAEMSGGEAVAIGCSSAVVQCLWQARKRVLPVQAAFSTMNIAISVTVAYMFYHWQRVQDLTHGTLLGLLLASMLYFGVNTAGVATVIALTERKPVIATWRECYFWSFPFYLMSASLVWIVRSVDVRGQWLNVLALLPVIYVSYYSYRMYLDRVEAGRKEIELANALQKRTIEALEAAREASTLKSRFVASVSHELRTPLNGIVGFAEMLYDGVLGPLNDLQRECVGDMLSCSSHLRVLIGHVLDLARVEAGKMTFTYEATSVSALVREVIGTLQTIARSRQIEVVVQADERVDSVLADTSRLKQVLYNYLSNALKFASTGGVVKVAVWAEDRESYRIDVEDDGPGIPADELPRLFSEFGQLGISTQSKTGSGLGLAISKSIVEAQGGRVGVVSELGKGSTFFVVLPRAPKPSVASGADPADPNSHEAEATPVSAS